MIIVVGRGSLGVEGDGFQGRDAHNAPKSSPSVPNPRAKQGHGADHRAFGDLKGVCDLALGKLQKLSLRALSGEQQDVVGDFSHRRGVGGLGSRSWTGFLLGFHGEQGP